jgi:hypothetical protein
MDCRQFRENHFAFVDDTLPGIELVGMQMHLTECPQCANHDALVRRSLMLFRSLPRIEPSEDFGQRLEEKLREVRITDSAAQSGKSRKFAAAVAFTSVAMLGYIGFSLQHVDSAKDITFPPVVALAIDNEAASTVPAPEMVAAISAGVPIWTAALLAEQTPVHFASLEVTVPAR